MRKLIYLHILLYLHGCWRKKIKLFGNAAAAARQGYERIWGAGQNSLEMDYRGFPAYSGVRM